MNIPKGIFNVMRCG